MPSEIETLYKVLKLERDNNYNNRAVIGGIKKYSDHWRDKARQEAKVPKQHILIDEMFDLMQTYDALENVDERQRVVNYMMDRIMNRAPAPEQYQARMGQYEALTPPKPERERRPRERPTERERNPRSAGGSTKPNRREAISESSDYTPDMYTPVTPSRSDLPPEPRLARPPRKPRRKMDAQEAADILRGLNAPVEKMKGIGPRIGKSLENMGLHTINDVLFYLPRRYDDYSKLLYISKLQPGMIATIIGTISDSQVRVGRTGRKDLYIELDDGSAVLSITFFGAHYLSKPLRRGKQIVVRGKVSIYRNRMQMSNPEWQELDREDLKKPGIVPVYRLTEGLTGRRLRQLMQTVIDYWAERIPDYVPASVLERAELADLGWTVQNLHFPAGSDHLHHAQRRYIFDQLLLLQLSILANRRDWQSVPGEQIQVGDDWLEAFINQAFPYELTGAQRRAINDIRADIAQSIPMNRLLQGDVGSGKTAVAVIAMGMTVINGKQAVLMAPTGILAEQHYRGISKTLESFPAERPPVVALLTSSLNNTERESIYRGLADGSIDIVIGTHAIIQSGVEFKDLGLAIIDEQHRFGVEQRGALRGKGTNPHLLIMTATPIPRTMALTIYADLDLSVMDEMPPGRTPVDTRVVLPSERERIYGFINQQIEAGRQAFIVHPLVEASDKIDAASAVEAYETLSQVFFRYRVCLLHGKMKPGEKDEIMAAFAAHEYDIMVTTSVAEVGVDIPNASVIVIEGANRFGLAQLHQFRGRVGRGQHESYCMLIPDDATADTAKQLEAINTWDDVKHSGFPESVRRLRAMEMTTDGFKLAEVDWELRGAGDLVGTRQSGRNQLQIAEMMSPELVQLAQQEARTIYEEDRYLDHAEHHLLRERVTMLYNADSDFS